MKNTLLARSSDIALRTVVAVVVPQGGEGKSFIASLNACVARLANLKIVLGTNDGTNKSLESLLGDMEVATLGWDADAPKGKAVVDRQSFNDIICIDVGANSDPTDGRFLDFMSGVKHETSRFNARVVVFVPSATNKAGGLDSAINAATVYQDSGFQTRLILNNRDGSWNVGDETKIPKNMPLGYLQHLDTGLQAYRAERDVSMYDLINNPTPGYEMASSRIRNFILRVAHSTWMKDVFWWDGALTSLPQPGSDPELSRTIQRLSNVSNAALYKNHEIYKAREKFIAASSNSQEFLNVARKFQELLKS